MNGIVICITFAILSMYTFPVGFVNSNGKVRTTQVGQFVLSTMRFVVNLCRIDRYIDYATVLAHSSVMRYRLGAVIIKSGKIIGAGHNKPKYSKLSENHWSKTIHAEIDAILKSHKDLKGATMFVGRIVKNGKTAMAKPCNSCQTIIDESGIKAVYYTTTEGFECLKII